MFNRAHVTWGRGLGKFQPTTTWTSDTVPSQSEFWAQGGPIRHWRDQSWRMIPDPASTQLYSQKQWKKALGVMATTAADNSFCNCVTCCAITIETIHKAQHWKTRETSAVQSCPDEVRCIFMVWYQNGFAIESTATAWPPWIQNSNIKSSVRWHEVTRQIDIQHNTANKEIFLRGMFHIAAIINPIWILDVDLGAASSLFWYNPYSHYWKETPLYTHIPQGFTIMDIRWRSCLSCLTSLWTKGFDITKCLHGHPSFHQCSRQSGMAGLFPVAARSFPREPLGSLHNWWNTVTTSNVNLLGYRQQFCAKRKSTKLSYLYLHDSCLVRLKWPGQKHLACQIHRKSVKSNQKEQQHQHIAHSHNCNPRSLQFLICFIAFHPDLFVETM